LIVFPPASTVTRSSKDSYDLADHPDTCHQSQRQTRLVIGPATFLRRRRAVPQGDRGSASISFLLVSVTLIVVIGLVVDGAGKIQANDRADLVAASAARTATNAIGGDTVRVGALSLDPVKAVAEGEAYLAAAGMAGSVSVTGEVVTVTVTTTYTTRFLSLIGIVELPGSGEASARLITE
jgi:hypothetical protein